MQQIRKVKESKYKGLGFVGCTSISYAGLNLSGRSVKVLVAKEGNVTSLHANARSSESARKHNSANIDYCDSAISLISVLEEDSYELVFVDYNLRNIDLCSLLQYLNELRPETKLVVTSAPVWSSSEEKDEIVSLCSSCCHESFYDLDVEEFIKSVSTLKKLA